MNAEQSSKTAAASSREPAEKHEQPKQRQRQTQRQNQEKRKRVEIASIEAAKPRISVAVRAATKMLYLY